MMERERRGTLPDNEAVSPKKVVKLSRRGAFVREGAF